jgi:hypothetical protein
MTAPISLLDLPTDTIFGTKDKTTTMGTSCPRSTSFPHFHVDSRLYPSIAGLNFSKLFNNMFGKKEMREHLDQHFKARCRYRNADVDTIFAWHVM